MVQVRTILAQADGPPPEKAEEAPDWYLFEGAMKIAFELVHPTAKSFVARTNIAALGAQFSTKVNHEQTISWRPVGADIFGPATAVILISGARTSIKMNLGPTLDIAPGALFHKAKENWSAGIVSVVNYTTLFKKNEWENILSGVNINDTKLGNQIGNETRANVLSITS